VASTASRTGIVMSVVYRIDRAEEYAEEQEPTP